MATKRMKNQFVMKKEKPPMTPFCEAIHDRLQIAMAAADSLLESNNEFKEQIESIEEDLQKTGIEKAGKNPGYALKHMLAKWSDEPYYTQLDTDRHSRELWISLGEFEKFLKEQEFGMEIELKNSKIQYRTRVDGMRA